MYFAFNRIRAFSPLLNVNAVNQKESSRQLFTFLNFIFNRVSKSRVEAVGPDRACAEWLMRNGAFVRWEGHQNFVPSYNALPLDPGIKGKFHIAEVDADNASIDKHGFPHFNGCKHVKCIKMKNCLLVNDACLEYLTFLKGSLDSLEIDKCNDVTDKGLLHLGKLVNLKSLRLGELASAENMKATVEVLKKSLPTCKIETAADWKQPSDGDQLQNELPVK